MNITEKKSAEKAKKIYEKLEIYKKYMNGKNAQKARRKRMEEEEKRKRALKLNTTEFIKQKMKQSLSQPKAFNKLELEDKKSKTKRDFRKINIKKDKKRIKRSGSEIIPVNKKKVLRLDAYNDINRIIEFIDNSRNNSQSKLCKGHFNNIQMIKEINNNLRKMIEKNEITYK